MSEEHILRVPDIGEFENVEVIELLVSEGDRVALDQSLVTLESEKATMEIPSEHAGVVAKLHVTLGDLVSEGSPLVTVTVDAEAAVSQEAGADAPAPKEEAPRAVESPAPKEEARRAVEPPPPSPAVSAPPARQAQGAVAAAAAEAQGAVAAVGAHASPSVRRLARELGVTLELVSGSGRKGRVTKEDVQGFVKKALREPAQTSPAAWPAAPEIDFTKFGAIETEPENKIRRASARNLHRSWVTIPHVTQFDEADITELEAFRSEKKAAAQERGVRLTLLSFLLRAVAANLADFPRMNASLSPDGESLIYKQYFHVGVAVDTENGLVVPVIRDVNRKGIWELAAELGEVSERARARKLTPADLSGGCFSISSLGGIGGTAFTPIVNPPEVGILGVSRSRMTPVFRDGSFEPRLMLPLSLSYDHRVIDGALAARFTGALAERLSDIRNLLL